MANLYDLKRFDLNLLVIFECIYQQLSISKAADMLFITPSAVSQSLQRLRIQLNDPLFIRAGKGITPTTVATNLHHHLVENLNNLEQTINMMNNSDLKKRFVIYGPQFYCSPEFSQLMTLLMSKPDLQVEYHDTEMSKDSVEELLNYRKADIILSLTPVNNRALVCQPFLDVNTVLICREGHPRLHGSATLEEILQEKFTFYMSKDSSITTYQHSDEEFFTRRQYSFYSSSIMSIFNTIRQTNLVGVVPAPFFDTFKDTLKLKKIDIPITLPGFKYYIIYNRSMMNSDTFKEIILNLPALKPSPQE